MSKSVKITNYVLNGAGEGLQHTTRTGRWIKVYRVDPFDLGAGFVLEAGNEMLPADYREEHTELDNLVSSMREIADLRSWKPCEY